MQRNNYLFCLQHFLDAEIAWCVNTLRTSQVLQLDLIRSWSTPQTLLFNTVDSKVRELLMRGLGLSRHTSLISYHFNSNGVLILLLSVLATNLTPILLSSICCTLRLIQGHSSTSLLRIQLNLTGSSSKRGAHKAIIIGSSIGSMWLKTQTNQFISSALKIS